METKKYSRLSAFLLVSVCLASCDDPFEGDTFVTPTDLDEEMSCTAVLEKHEEEFSLWLDLLHYADYYNGLKNPDAEATLFAPTNEAMTAFLAWKGVERVEDLDKSYAVSVVQVHILSGMKIPSETLVNNAVDGLALSYMTLFKSYLVPTFGRQITDVDDVDRDSTILDAETIFLNNQAAVQPRDSGGVQFIEASNAIIYYMDDVIHPLTETMIEKLEEQGEYTIFAAAARESGYDAVAEKVRDTIRVAGGGSTVQTYEYTCFAPCDAAFNKDGIHSVEDLKAKIGSGDSALYKYVAYHFLDRRCTKEDFFAFDTPDQILIYDTNLTTQVVTCENDFSTGDTIPIINKKARVLRSNIEARNGLIHKIDYYLPVWEPDPIEVKWDFCNSADIIAFVNGYGAEKNLGNLYSTPLSNREYQIDLTEKFRDGQFGEITCLTYLANDAKSSASTYRQVGYMKCKYISSREKNTNAYDAYLNNLLVLNLGYAGWVQFTTPTIIKGKYRVTLHYASDALLSRSYYAAGSLTKFQLDPELDNPDLTQNTYIFKGLPSSTYVGSADIVLFNEVDFEVSAAHVLKATMLDINAKTDRIYHQYWDYVLFTPISE